MAQAHGSARAGRPPRRLNSSAPNVELADLLSARDLTRIRRVSGRARSKRRMWRKINLPRYDGQVGTVRDIAASIDDLVVLRSTNEGTDVPNPALQPERVRNVELGLKAGGRRLQATAVVYSARYNDLIDRRPGTYLGLPFIDDNGNGFADAGEDAVVQKFNVGAARIRGIELDAAWPVGEHVRWFANIAYARGDNLSSDEPLSRIPPLTAMVGVRLDAKNQRWWVEPMLTGARQ